MMLSLCLTSCLIAAACGGPAPNGGTDGGLSTSTATGGTSGGTAANTSGASASSSNTTGTTGGPTSFDGGRAMTLLQAQCDLGPRPMGTSAHESCLQWILQQLTPNVDLPPLQQSFSYTSPGSGKTFTVTNVIGVINPQAPTRVMLAAHWDTRPVADQEPDPANRTKPILGADDGASETAVLLELARVFHQSRPTVGVELVFFDGEDYSPAPGNYDEMYLGSKYFADHLGDFRSRVRKSGRGRQAWSLKPNYGILLDMIGDNNLDIYQEVNSVQQARAIVDKVWAAAAALGNSQQFIPYTRYTITDDHLPLLAKGIPVIDCIDFDYEVQQTGSPRQYWHTLQDTPDKCSAASLQIVGNVMSKVIYDEH